MTCPTPAYSTSEKHTQFILMLQVTDLTNVPHVARELALFKVGLPAQLGSPVEQHSRRVVGPGSVGVPGHLAVYPC